MWLLGIKCKSSLSELPVRSCLCCFFLAIHSTSNPLQSPFTSVLSLPGFITRLCVEHENPLSAKEGSGLQPTKGPLCGPNLRSLCVRKLSPLNQVEHTHLLALLQADSSKVYTDKVTPCVASSLTRAQPRAVTGLATSLSVSLTSPLLPDACCSAVPLPIHSCCSLGSASSFSALRMLTVGGEAEKWAAWALLLQRASGQGAQVDRQGKKNVE